MISVLTGSSLGSCTGPCRACPGRAYVAPPAAIGMSRSVEGIGLGMRRPSRRRAARQQPDQTTEISKHTNHIPGEQMTNIVREVVVSCPPDRVFALLSDVQRLPEF